MAQTSWFQRFLLPGFAFKAVVIGAARRSCWSPRSSPRSDGLVDLIARGYRVLAALILVTFVLPLLTFGLWRLVKGRPATPANA